MRYCFSVQFSVLWCGPARPVPSGPVRSCLIHLISREQSRCSMRKSFCQTQTRSFSSRIAISVLSLYTNNVQKLSTKYDWLKDATRPSADKHIFKSIYMFVCQPCRPCPVPPPFAIPTAHGPHSNERDSTWLKTVLNGTGRNYLDSRFFFPLSCPVLSSCFFCEWPFTRICAVFYEYILYSHSKAIAKTDAVLSTQLCFFSLQIFARIPSIST